MTADPSRISPPRGSRIAAAALLSRVANEMTPVAVVLLVLERGGGAALAGVTAGALALAGVITGPLLGAWLDRARRPLRVIAAEQAIGAAGLAALAALAGHVPPAAMVALAIATGALQPLSTGGMTSILTLGADEDVLGRSSSREAASFGAANVAGPLLAAVLVGIGGAVVAVLAQAGLKLAAMALTLTSRDAPARARAAGPASVADGFRHFANTAPLAAITATGAVAMGGRGLLTVAFPFFAVEALSRPDDFSGFMWAAFALGVAVGALAFRARLARWPVAAVAVAGAGLTGLALLPLPAVDSPVVALVVLVVAGALYGPSLAATFEVRRRLTPPALLGQVFTTAASVKTGCLAVGASLSGLLVAAVGAGEAIAVAAAVHVLATALGALLHRVLQARR